MTVNGVDGGNQPINNPKKNSEPKVIKSDVEKGSLFKDQLRNDCGRLAREITYFDFNNDGKIMSDEILAVSQYIYTDDGVQINQVFDRKNANGENKPDGKADADFRVYKYDNDGNLVNKWNDESQSFTEKDIADFIDYGPCKTNITSPTETTNTTEAITTTTTQATDTTETVTTTTTQATEAEDVVMVKTGIDKGANYREQIREDGRIVAEFSYHDYNNDGNIDTSEMTSAAFYNYGSDGVQIAQYVDRDHDNKTDGELTLYNYDKDANLVGEKIVEKDDAYKGVDMNSLRDAVVDPLNEAIEEAIDKEFKKDK